MDGAGIAMAAAMPGLVERVFTGIVQMRQLFDITGRNLVGQSARAGAGERKKRQAENVSPAKINLCGTRIVMAVLRGRPALQIRGRRHADHVGAGVHEVHFAGDAARERAKQIKCRPADMVKVHGALQRRMGPVPFEHHAGIAHRTAGQGPHRPGRDGVDPDMPRPSSEARYRMAASSAALATPITL